MPLLRHRDRIEGDLVIEVAFTDVSLSLGDAADDAVRTDALALLARETGAAPVLMHQVHGAEVESVEVRRGRGARAVVRRPGDLAARRRPPGPGRRLRPRPAGRPGHRVDRGRAQRPARAGRRGRPAAVAAVRERGGDPATAWIGPHVCGACYEVPADLQEQVAAVVPEARSTTSWGTPGLDLGAGVRAQLAAAGIDDVRTVDACTREDASWPSYRRDGDAATRFAGVIWSHR